MAALTSAEITVAQAQMNTFAGRVKALFKSADDAKKTAFIAFGTGDLEQRLTVTRDNVERDLVDMQRFVQRGVIANEAATRDGVAGLVRRTIADLDAYGKAVSDWNKIFPSEKLAGVLSNIGTAAADLLSGLGGLISTGAKALNWLPWIVGLIFLGPPLIKILLAAKSGGTEGALRETGGTLERGRASVTRGARNAASAAKFFL